MSVLVAKKLSYLFSKDNEPELEVNPGDTVKFITDDCFGSQIKSEDDLVTEAVDFTKANPGTGPVYIKGAEVGDVISVEILDIEVADKGFSVTLPGTGPLGDITESRTRLIPIKDGMAEFNGLKFPIKPMIGVIGVAPKGEAVPTAMWGPHGGNMDNKKITAGTTLYFPVNVDGALLQIGDLHAVQGDGELCGTGIEVAGSATVKLGLIKDFKLNGPLHEVEDKWYTIANNSDFEKAVEIATKDMLDLMMRAYKWDETDSFIYMSLQGDIEICQSAVPSTGDSVVRMGIPKLKDKPLIK